MHARRWVHPNFGHWGVQAVLGIPNLRPLKILNDFGEIDEAMFQGVERPRELIFCILEIKT
jgi:hypothetical protein